ncbi:MAG: amino acid-binding protein [Bacteroidales bacterium]
MTIHQLSVFLENKAGTLVNLFETLKKAKIQLIATTVADTVEYGICRIVCTEPLRAYETLKKADVAVTLSDVFAIEMDNKPGSAADAISIISKEGIAITYLYSFIIGGKGVLILRTDNADKAKEVILLNHLRLIAETDLAKLV